VRLPPRRDSLAREFFKSFIEDVYRILLNWRRDAVGAVCARFVATFVVCLTSIHHEILSSPGAVAFLVLRYKLINKQYQAHWLCDTGLGAT
jgi:hypothetical protein